MSPSMRFMFGCTASSVFTAPDRIFSDYCAGGPRQHCGIIYLLTCLRGMIYLVVINLAMAYCFPALCIYAGKFISLGRRMHT